MTTPEPSDPRVEPALAAAVAAVAGRPVADPGRSARRATAVIEAIRAACPGPSPDREA